MFKNENNVNKILIAKLLFEKENNYAVALSFYKVTNFLLSDTIYLLPVYTNGD